MEAKSKSNFSNMKQKELSKLINDKTIAVKPANKEEVVLILSTVLPKHDNTTSIRSK